MSSTYCRKVSLSRVRQVSPSDAERICYKLQEAMDKIDDPYLKKKCTAEYVTEQVVSGNMDAVILDDTYLVCYQVGSPWYSTKVFLTEQLVLKIGTGSNFSSVCDLLDDMQEFFGTDEIVVGGGLSSRPDLLAAKYEENGYSKLRYPSLIKRR